MRHRGAYSQVLQGPLLMAENMAVTPLSPSTSTGWRGQSWPSWSAYAAWRKSGDAQNPSKVSTVGDGLGSRPIRWCWCVLSGQSFLPTLWGLLNNLSRSFLWISVVLNLFPSVMFSEGQQSQELCLVWLKCYLAENQFLRILWIRLSAAVILMIRCREPGCFPHHGLIQQHENGALDVSLSLIPKTKSSII